MKDLVGGSDMKTLLVIGVLAGAAVVFGGGLSDEQYNRLTSDISKQVSAKNYDNVARMVGGLATDDSGRAVRFLLGLVGRVKDQVDVLSAIVDTLALMSSDEAVSALVSGMRSGSEKSKVVAVEGAAGVASDKVTKALIKALEDSSELVAVSAARALGKRGDRAAISPMIEAMEKVEKRKRERVSVEISMALERITGHSGPEAAVDWKGWWQSHKDQPLPRDTGVTTPSPFKPGRMRTTVFGRAIRSKRIIFVIDVSGSMEQADPPPKNWREEVEKKMRTTVWDPKEKKKKMKEAEKEMKNWKKERRRIYRVKKELTRVIKSLPKDAKFNIISFSDVLDRWKKSLAPATDGNKANAVGWVEKLKADGLTHTDEALQEAFKDKQADTIILLTDGAPTHIGGDAKPEWGGHEDSMALIKEILEWVRKENRFRKVTIHTFGFMGANFEFLQELSRENNGKFTDVK